MSGYDTRVLIAGVPADPCRVVLPLEIRHGRSQLTTQPDAPECTFAWVGNNPPEVGQSVVVDRPTNRGRARWVDDTAAWATGEVAWSGSRGRSLRFAGRVDSVRARESRGQVVLWEVTALGGQARLGVTPVRLDRPAESDVARVQAICAASGVAVTILGDPGVTLAADSIDRDALAALHEVCKSSGGLLWQARGGRLTYGTQHHRDTPADQLLPCTVILDGLDWDLQVDRVINHVTVVWRAEDSEHQITLTDSISIGQWGRRHQEVATMVADQSQAQLLGALILARRAQPRWVMPGVVVLADRCTPAEVDAVTALEVSTGVLLPVPTTPGPTPGELRQWTVEGWVERWDSQAHRWQLALSDRLASETSGLRNWAEVRDGGTWAHWAAGTWIQQLVKVEG